MMTRSARTNGINDDDASYTRTTGNEWCKARTARTYDNNDNNDEVRDDLR